MGRTKKYLLSTRAKVLVSARQLGIKVPKSLLQACDNLHNALLIHDDIEDDERYRAGKLATWVRIGVPRAINLGDLLLFDALKIIAQQKPRSVPTVLKALLEIASGQADDLVGKKEFVQVAWRKTGLFKFLPLFTLSQDRPKWPSLLWKIAKPLGAAIQAGDDLKHMYRSYKDKGAAVSLKRKPSIFKKLGVAVNPSTRQQVRNFQKNRLNAALKLLRTAKIPREDRIFIETCMLLLVSHTLPSKMIPKVGRDGLFFLGSVSK